MSMNHDFKFLRVPENEQAQLGQPEATRRVDELMTQLQEKKGRLHAELVFHLFTTRIRVNIEKGKDVKSGHGLAATTARLVSAVVQHVWPDEFDAKFDELMADVNDMTDDVFQYLRPAGAAH